MLKRLAWLLALSLLIVVMVLAGWFVFTRGARVVREAESVEELDAGNGRWVRTPDAALHVREWGAPKAPVLLLVHGLGAWSGTWFDLPQALAAAGWRVVAVDLPPFGLSKTAGPPEQVDYTRAGQARRLLALINSLGTPVTLVAHSFGSGPALEAAMLGGPRVRRLVLVDPALGLGPQGEPSRCTASAGFGLLPTSRSLRTWLIGATASWPGWSAPLLRQFVHRRDVVTPPLVAAYQMPLRHRGFSAALGDWALAFSNANCETAHSLDAAQLSRWSASAPPVALIWGREDGVTPLAQGVALQARLKDSQLTVLPDVGHIPHIESPAAFAAALLKAPGPPP